MGRNYIRRIVRTNSIVLSGEANGFSELRLDEHIILDIVVGYVECTLTDYNNRFWVEHNQHYYCILDNSH